jgi:BRCA1-associated protein
LYALELETQRVWDYAGDGYVHRLIQNRADGKLVELPSASSSMGVPPRDGGSGPGPADALSAEKIEAIGIEYSYLLTSQLDSQRSYYEEQAAEMKEELSQMKAIVQQLSEQFDQERVYRAETERERMGEAERQATEAAKDRMKAEARATKMTELARRLERELKEERAVNEGLVKNLKSLKEKMDRAEQEKQERAEKITDLEDQLRDLMFFLEANTKIEQGGGVASELAGGSVEIPNGPTREGNPSGGRKAARKAR